MSVVAERMYTMMGDTQSWRHGRDRCVSRIRDEGRCAIVYAGAKLSVLETSKVFGYLCVPNFSLVCLHTA